MSKLTLIGDAHGKMAPLQMIQSNCERSIQLGDVGFGFREIPNFGPKHQFIRGNHDNPVLAQAHYNYLGDFGYWSEGKETIFYISGAFSIDWMMRIEGESWWREEELSPVRLQDAIDMYASVKPTVVLSHDCPVSANKVLLADLVGNYFEAKKELTQSRTCQALQTMFAEHAPKLWVFGHYHITKRFHIGQTAFQCLAELATMEVDFE